MGWLFEHRESLKYIQHTDCVFKGLFDTDVGSYGLSFITNAFSDRVLLRVAHAFERLTTVPSNEPKPTKLPKTELKDVLQKAEKS